MTKGYITKMYLEYVNDFLTVERFASFHGLTIGNAMFIIKMGKIINDRD